MWPERLVTDEAALPRDGFHEVAEMTDSLRLAVVVTGLVLALSIPLPLSPGAEASAAKQAAPDAAASVNETSTQSVDDDDDHHGMWGDWDGWGWWLFMVPMLVLFWGGMILGILWFGRQLFGGTSSRENDAVEVARRRYARGEISREEFEQIRRDLNA